MKPKKEKGDRFAIPHFLVGFEGCFLVPLDLFRRKRSVCYVSDVFAWGYGDLKTDRMGIEGPSDGYRFDYQNNRITRLRGLNQSDFCHVLYLARRFCLRHRRALRIQRFHRRRDEP